MASDDGRVALIDVCVILDLFGIEIGQHFGDAEAVDTGVLEHTGGPEKTGLHDSSAARAAILTGSGSPFHAPEAADLAAHGLAAMNAQVAGLPIDGLRAGARFADGAHGLAAEFADAPPQVVLLGRAHDSQFPGNLVFRQSFAP